MVYRIKCNIILFFVFFVFTITSSIGKNTYGVYTRPKEEIVRGYNYDAMAYKPTVIIYSVFKQGVWSKTSETIISYNRYANGELREVSFFDLLNDSLVGFEYNYDQQQRILNVQKKIFSSRNNLVPTKITSYSLEYFDGWYKETVYENDSFKGYIENYLDDQGRVVKIINNTINSFSKQMRVANVWEINYLNTVDDRIIQISSTSWPRHDTISVHRYSYQGNTMIVSSDVTTDEVIFDEAGRIAKITTTIFQGQYDFTSIEYFYDEHGSIISEISKYRYKGEIAEYIEERDKKIEYVYE